LKDVRVFLVIINLRNNILGQFTIFKKKFIKNFKSTNISKTNNSLRFYCLFIKFMNLMDNLNYSLYF